jgi:hypothetical protein
MVAHQEVMGEALVAVHVQEHVHADLIHPATIIDD